MRNIDLEKFYSKSKETLKVIAAFMGSGILSKLIIACRLKPITIFSKTFKDGRLEYWWVDEFGNSLKLNNREYSVIINDKNISYNTKISTDLFCCNSLIDIMEKSKSLLISDKHLLFYGHDEYFRCFDLSGNKISPLEIGIDNLFMFLNNIYAKYKKFDNGNEVYSLPNIEMGNMLKKEYNK